jgi:site-specific recombinase XerD
MPAAVALADDDVDLVEAYVTAMQSVGKKTGRSTVQAAKTFCAKTARAGSFETMSRTQQLDAVGKARSFSSWLMLTGRLVVDPVVLGRLDLRLGGVARRYCPEAHAWFAGECARLGVSPEDTSLQWNALVKVTAITGTPPEEVGDAEFAAARQALVAAYASRELPESGRGMASHFHRLQLTLFHAGRLNSLARPTKREPVSVTGWLVVAPGIAAAARRYVAQVELSLRSSTTKHIEQDLRVFATFLAEAFPDVATCADLERQHIEAYKIWLATTQGYRTGKPLNRVTVKSRLVNLHCFFDRITEWGYPDAPVRPLVFAGDLPIIDKPLPRFLDDASAAKLLRTSRADPDPLSRLIVELLARTGIRRGELLGLTADAVVQIGSAFWLRIPVGKLHNDRYIPLHPQLKEMLDDWVENHRPTGLRTDRLLVEHNRPVTGLRVANTLKRHAAEAGIDHVTAHQLRHTLATQAINRGMSLDAIAALLGHKTLAMTMVYARIADKTVADEYFAVTEKVEALYDQPRRLPESDEGAEMRKLRGEMHRRMLGNGLCARPVELDCHFETICESCTYFVTTIEFRPTLQAQRDDAERKGQVGRQRVFEGLLSRLTDEAS